MLIVGTACCELLFVGEMVVDCVVVVYIMLVLCVVGGAVCWVFVGVAAVCWLVMLFVGIGVACCCWLSLSLFDVCCCCCLLGWLAFVVVCCW